MHSFHFISKSTQQMEVLLAFFLISPPPSLLAYTLSNQFAITVIGRIWLLTDRLMVLTVCISRHQVSLAHWENEDQWNENKNVLTHLLGCWGEAELPEAWHMSSSLSACHKPTSHLKVASDLPVGFRGGFVVRVPSSQWEATKGT